MVCQRLAPYSRNRSFNSGGAEARPIAVLANSGKNATMVAQTTSATNGSPTQMMISGAMAGSGVTCRATAQGWIAACARRLADIATAIAAPSTAATSSAAKVTNNVEASARSSPTGSAANAPMIAIGPGN